MPAKTAAKPTVTLESIRPTAAQWRQFREGRNERYWGAAMLSLQVLPTDENKNALKVEHPDVYKEYRTRLTVLLKRRVSYSAIRPLGADGQLVAPSKQHVSLPGVAKLACELGWEGAEEFSKLVSAPVKAKTLDGLVSLKISDVEFEKQVNAVGAGQKRTLVRYAALVHLLRMAIDSPVEFGRVREASLGKRTTVSMQSLGEAVTRAVATIANESGNRRIPSGFGKDKNADEIAFAERMVKTYF
jgi:hypothetical protein